MSIEKCPTNPAQSVANAKGSSAAKASKGIASPSEKTAGQDAFSDLLLGLGVDEADSGDAPVASLQVAAPPVVTADLQAENTVALLAQQDWSLGIIPMEPDAPNDGQAVSKVKTFASSGSLPSKPISDEMVIAKDALMEPLTPIGIGLSEVDAIKRDSDNHKLVKAADSSDSVVGERVIVKNVVMESFTSLGKGYSEVDVGKPNSGEKKVVSVANSLEPEIKNLPTERLLTSTQILKMSVKDGRPAEHPDGYAGIDRVLPTRADVGQFERKSLVEMLPKFDALRLAVTQASVEFNLNGMGAQSDFRREKMIFKSSAVEANAVINIGADLSHPVSNVGALLSDGSVGTAIDEPTQSAYWVSGDMKNAEMTLDGIGEGSVEVSINLHGKEAHVSFRTDEDQTRAALQEAESTLKDMLRREGLELSGVSVGLAGSNLGSGADRGQDPGPQADFRPFKIDSGGQSGGGDRSQHIGRRQSGNLDVFV